MTGTRPQRLPRYIPTALLASDVGTWETDFLADRTVCDSTTAALFALDPTLTARGLPLGHYLRAIHPDDLPAFANALADVRQRGGLFVIEYRTLPRSGEVRWVLARGRYEVDEAGELLRGSGIVIDVTESKQDGYVEGQALATWSDPSADPLDRAVEAAIVARKAIDALGVAGLPRLRPAADALLMALGRHAATNAVPDADPVVRPSRRRRH